jgi:hypothetical protein
MGRSSGTRKISSKKTMSRSEVGNASGLEEFLREDENGVLAGDIIYFGKDGELVLADGDPTMTMAGMAEVESAVFLYDEGIWQVNFKNGESALVDLDNMAVAGAENDILARGALAYALAEDALLSNSETPSENALSDMHGKLKERDDEESFRNRAIAALAVIEERGKNPELDALMEIEEDQAPEGFDPKNYKGTRGDLAEVTEAILKARQENGNRHLPEEALALLGRAIEDPNEVEKFQEQEDMFWQGALALANYDEEEAKKLIPRSDIVLVESPQLDENGEPKYILDENGEKIPHLDSEGNPVTDLMGNVVYECEPKLDAKGNPIMESIGAFDVDDDIAEKLKQIGRAVDTQSRFFLSFGRPGTGKNALEEQYAALVGAAYTEFVFNGETDLQILIGADGLEYRAAYDEDGKIVGGGTESTVSQGPLARALAEPGVTSLQEVIEQRSDFTTLNAALGSDVSDPSKRVLTISSSKGDFNYEVHPDHLIFASFNQGLEDARMEPSTHERAGFNLVYDVPPAEVFSKRLGRMVSNVMTRSPSMPSGLKRNYDAKEMLPFAQVMESLNENYDSEHEDFIMAPDPRTMVRAVNQFMTAAYNGDDDPIRKFRNTFHYCLRTTGDSDYEYRDDLLEKIMTQQEPALKRLSKSIAKENPNYREPESDSENDSSTSNDPSGE